LGGQILVEEGRDRRQYRVAAVGPAVLDDVEELRRAPVHAAGDQVAVGIRGGGPGDHGRLESARGVLGEIDLPAGTGRGGGVGGAAGGGGEGLGHRVHGLVPERAEGLRAGLPVRVEDGDRDLRRRGKGGRRENPVEAGEVLAAVGLEGDRAQLDPLPAPDRGKAGPGKLALVGGLHAEAEEEAAVVARAALLAAGLPAVEGRVLLAGNAQGEGGRGRRALPVAEHAAHGLAHRGKHGEAGPVVGHRPHGVVEGE